MYEARQVPGVPSPPPEFDTQFFEQQSPAPTVHASPSVLQPLPPGSAAQWFAVHTPEQQSAPVAHPASSCLQAVPPQTPDVQESVQHSPDDAHELPAALQKVPAAQVLLPIGPVHIAEQQSAPFTQLAPADRQTVVGEAHTPEPLEVSQNPEQQSAAAVQEVERSLQVFAGSVQTPFAHAFVQQSALVRQLPPAALQVAVPTQVFPAQPRPVARAAVRRERAGLVRGASRPASDTSSPRPTPGRRARCSNRRR